LVLLQDFKEADEMLWRGEISSRNNYMVDKVQYWDSEQNWLLPEAF